MGAPVRMSDQIPPYGRMWNMSQFLQQIPLLGGVQGRSSRSPGLVGYPLGPGSDAVGAALSRLQICSTGRLRESEWAETLLHLLCISLLVNRTNEERMIEIQLIREDNKAVVTIDGAIFTEYRYGHYVCRPYFYPVLTADGQRLTRGYPMELVEGESQDHYHHRGVYVAHGLVNGFNLWDEGTGHGAMLQRGDPVVGSDSEVATIEGMVDWYGPEGQRVLEERRSIRIRPDEDFRVVDHHSEFRASYGDVTFGDTKEGGLFSIRVPTSMDAKDKGRIENSEGQIYESGQGEETTWGRQAAWVDYSGSLANGQEWGHTVIDHKDNPRHPTYWHVRGYGLFTANPFGVHDFKGDKSIDESLTIKAGDNAVFRYRWIVHPGRGIGNSRIRELIDEFQVS